MSEFTRRSFLGRTSGAPGSFAALQRVPKRSHDPLVLRLPPTIEQSGIGARRIFVIKRVTCEEGETIQHILILDDHPDSLSLAFGRRTSPQAGWITPPSAKWWELPLGWMLLLGVLLMMLFLLFLKLPS